jgi:outer membrane protein insertion porin family
VRIIVLFLAVLFWMSEPALAVVIKNITLKGNERISESTINAYLTLNQGTDFSQAQADQSIKSLYATGFFSNVKIYLDNNNLVVEVTENPLIAKVAFDGNKRINDDEILPELSMKARTVLSKSKLQEDMNRIIYLYQKKGRYSVKIEPKIIKLDQNRVNLIYEIDEGREARIQKVNFIGNDYYSDTQLKDVIVSKEYRWYNFFSDADVYDPDKSEYDRELLRRYYLNKGFADVKISPVIAELNQQRNAFLLTYTIEEGKVYTVSEINIVNHLKNLNVDMIKPLIEIKEGSRFSQDDLDYNVDKITNYLGDNGFPFSEIEIAITPNRAQGIAKVSFIIKDSYKMYINRITIKNNTRTLDKVIRREFKISEGDPYNISKIQRSKQRVENLGFFNKVDFKNRRNEQEDKMDIDVEVEETSTGFVRFAAGFNTMAGVIGQIGVNESNFLGTGKEVGFAISQGQNESSQSLSFTDPYFMDRDLSAGFDIYNSTRDLKRESSFSERNTGIVLRMGYNLTEHLSHSIRYVLAKESIYHVRGNASKYVELAQGKKLLSLIGQTLTYDKLDNLNEPSEGFYGELKQDFAGLGGQLKFLRHEAKVEAFVPFLKKELVFATRAKAGNITGLTIGRNHQKRQVRLADRFFLGQDLVRGFDQGGLGPRDKATGDALGGNNYAGVNAELIFPVKYADNVKAILFIDSGLVWGIDKFSAASLSKVSGVNAQILNSKTMRVSAGPALQWISPFGTISFSYGIPLRKERFDDIQKFYLNFGTRF